MTSVPESLPPSKQGNKFIRGYVARLSPKDIRVRYLDYDNLVRHFLFRFVDVPQSHLRPYSAVTYDGQIGGSSSARAILITRTGEDRSWQSTNEAFIV